MTDAPAVFDATFSDWRLVKGRKVVQIVLEVPLETAGLAYQVLGGMPDPGKSVWCAVARLKGGDASEGSRTSSTVDTPPHSHSETVNKPQAGGAKRKWDEMSPAQQAGVLCADPRFQLFLVEQGFALKQSGEAAAEAVRTNLGVNSRRQIVEGSDAEKRWEIWVQDYRAWMQYPEVVG